MPSTWTFVQGTLHLSGIDWKIVKASRLALKFWQKTPLLPFLLISMNKGKHLVSSCFNIALFAHVSKLELLSMHGKVGDEDICKTDTWTCIEKYPNGCKSSSSFLKELRRNSPLLWIKTRTSKTWVSSKVWRWNLYFIKYLEHMLYAV